MEVAQMPIAAATIADENLMVDTIIDNTPIIQECQRRSGC